MKPSISHSSNNSSSNPGKQVPGALRNPHFWVILIIVVSLTYLYYLPFSKSGIGPSGIWGYRVTEYNAGFTGSLFYLPIIYSAIVFGWRGIIVSWIPSFIILLPVVVYFAYNPSTLITNILFIMLPVIIGLLIIFSLKRANREKTNFIERENERLVYMSQVIKAQEDERKRLSQELHDDTIQTLLAIGNEIQYLIKKEKTNLTPEFSQQMERSYLAMFEVAEELRRISLNLRPSILDNIGLVEAIRWLVDNLDANGLNAKFTASGEIYKLPAGSDVHVFRFVQEALNNISKHAGASEVMVSLDYHPESVEITVQDNGKGFNVPDHIEKLSLIGKLGIMGMQDRARVLNGQFKIQSQPGKGTLVSLSFKAGNAAKPQ